MASAATAGRAEPPESLLCPLTSEVMVDPVVDPEGNTYERAAIEEWLSRNSTSPVTRAYLTKTMLVPNRALRELADAWRTKSAARAPAPSRSSASAAPAPAAASSSRVAALSRVGDVPAVPAAPSPTTAAAARAAAAPPLPLHSVFSPVGDDRAAPAGGGASSRRAASVAGPAAASGAAAERPSTATADCGVTLTVKAMPGTGIGSARREPDSMLVVASVKAPDDTRRTGADVCCVVDVSASMGSQAKVKDDKGGTEAHGLSLLDVVKHAVRTVIKTLGRNDRLAVVSYSTEAKVVLPLTVMNPKGVRAAERAVDAMTPSGRTNLWDGLHKGLELLRTEESENRNSAVLLLTDGCPNVVPPRGHLPMLRRYKETHGSAVRSQVHTFGFGYSLDSALLDDLAREGDGNYAFIPDASFVGTVFVHALANVLATAARNVTVCFEPATESASVLEPHGVVLGGYSTVKASWGTEVTVGTLQSGQSKDIAIVMKLAGSGAGSGAAGGGRGSAHSASGARAIAAAAAGAMLNVTVKFEACRPVTGGAEQAVTCHSMSIVEGDAESFPSVAEVLAARMRLDAVDAMRSANRAATAADGGGDRRGATAIVASTIATIKALFPAAAALRTTKGYDPLAAAEVVSPAHPYTPRQRMAALLDDLEGQVLMSISKAAAHKKWGMHFLPSIARAHEVQVAVNFKDPGVQFYGGCLFRQLRDAADAIFVKLPPPKPSIAVRPAFFTAPRYTSSTTGSDRSIYRSAASAGAGAGAGAGAAVRAPAPVASMARYHNRNAGCFAGDTAVAMADGRTKRADALVQGDVVATPTPGATATVTCVVKTNFASGVAELCELPGSGLVLTPYHPVRVPSAASGAAEGPMKWAFPCDLAAVKERPCAAVYSFVLDAAPGVDKVMLMNGVQGISLGHDLRAPDGVSPIDDPVASHPFFASSDAVVGCLSAMRGWDAGLVELQSGSLVRDPKTGLVVGYRQLSAGEAAAVHM